MYRLVFFNPRADTRERIDPGPWFDRPEPVLKWREVYVNRFGYSPSAIRFQRAGDKGVQFVSEAELSGRSVDADLASALASMV